MKKIKPKKLMKGDLIGLISPASNCANNEDLDNAVKYLEGLGYRVKVGNYVGAERGYLAGRDEERLDDLHNMFADKEVKAIFCIRGGYGSGRLLDKINYQLIKKNPKIFVGYSDITALQMAIYKKTGLITFAGPMPGIDFSTEISEFTEESFWSTITSAKKIGKLVNPHNEKFYVLQKGRAEGPLLGGNLSILMSLIGTEYIPNFKESIFILEEIGEAPYRIDRMFNSLRLAKITTGINGLLLGRFKNCYEMDENKKTLSLNEVINDYWSEAKIPVFYNVIHGHVKDSITIPFGVNCKINTSRGFIELTESAVV